MWESRLFAVVVAGETGRCRKRSMVQSAQGARRRNHWHRAPPHILGEIEEHGVVPLARVEELGNKIVRLDLWRHPHSMDGTVCRNAGRPRRTACGGCGCSTCYCLCM